MIYEVGKVGDRRVEEKNCWMMYARYTQLEAMRMKINEKHEK